MNPYSVQDPATFEVVGEAPTHGARDVDQAVQTAKTVSQDWSNDLDFRRSAMKDIAKNLIQSRSELAELLTREQGKPFREALKEFDVSAEMLEYYADLNWNENVILPTRGGKQVSVCNRPVGVVGTITPWNFPISLLSIKLAPALVAGCTIISKPSPTTPLSTLAMAKIFNETLPVGVLQVLTGPTPEISVALSEHKQIRKISFTGSTPVGVAVTKQAAASNKRVTMELGGNDPAILLDDLEELDIGIVAKRIAASAFRNAGQVCMAVKRVYVPKRLEAPFTEALVAETSKLHVGHGLNENTTMGPLHNSQQRDYVRELVEQALKNGGNLAWGGNTGSDLPGFFMEPTVITKAPPQSRLVLEEQFGPALPIVTYKNIEDLINQLNAEEFGLGASVWSQDTDKALRVGNQLEAGTIWLNQHTVVEPDAPFGGMKASGIGRERGPWGLEPYLEQQTINSRSLTDNE